jgi:hypothetical protein
MSGKECSCGGRFIDAEDFRDHLPCPGSASEQAYAAGERAAEARIMAWLGNLPKGDYSGPGLAWLIKRGMHREGK